MIRRQQYLNRQDPDFSNLERRCDRALEETLMIAPLQSPLVVLASGFTYSTVVLVVNAYAAAGWTGCVFVTNGDDGEFAIRFDL